MPSRIPSQCCGQSDQIKTPSQNHRFALLFPVYDIRHRLISLKITETKLIGQSTVHKTQPPPSLLPPFLLSFRDFKRDYMERNIVKPEIKGKNGDFKRVFFYSSFHLCACHCSSEDSNCRNLFSSQIK